MKCLQEPISEQLFSNQSTRESVKHLNELLASVNEEEEQLLTTLEQRKTSINQEKVVAMEQVIEDVRLSPSFLSSYYIVVVFIHCVYVFVIV